jgi:hypothetical protein
MRTRSKTLTLRLAQSVAKAGLALTLLLFQTLWIPAHADSLSPADEKSVRAVIDGQLAALAKDDAKKAFSYAAPYIREAVGSAAGFLTMVRRDYPVVYRPASVAFLKPEGKDDEVVQRVQMLDASGNSWLATYSLQRQKNRSWRITGCAVVQNKGRMT